MNLVPDSVTSPQRERLVGLLRERERSRAWLARQLRMNESQLSHTLAGRRRLPDGFWQRVAEILGVTTAELTERPAA